MTLMNIEGMVIMIISVCLGEAFKVAVKFFINDLENLSVSP